MREDDFDDDTEIDEIVAEQQETAMEQPPMPTIPPLRTFRVHRWEQTYDQATNFDAPKLVTHIIEAHQVQTNSRANLLQFLTYAIDPITGPGTFVRRAFNGWDSYQEVMAPAMVSGVTH